MDWEENCDALELGPFTYEENEELVKDQIDKFSSQTHHTVRKLAEKVQYLPLAALQSVMWLLDKEIPISEVAKMFQESNLQLFDLDFPGWCLSGLLKNALASWSNVLEDPTRKNETCLAMFIVYALLLPDYILTKIFNSSLSQESVHGLFHFLQKCSMFVGAGAEKNFPQTFQLDIHETVTRIIDKKAEGKGEEKEELTNCIDSIPIKSRKLVSPNCGFIRLSQCS